MKCSDRELVMELSRFVHNMLGNGFDHGYPHVERVWRLAYEIVEYEGLSIDPCILDIAVLLHDIGRVLGEPHAYYSALITRSILEDHGFDEQYIGLVVNAILYHSYSYVRRYGVKPLCEEAKVLSDADKLDALGVVGFIRVFLFERERSIEETINHFYEKILKLPNLMHYNYTRRKAEQLKDRVLKLLEWFHEEIGEIKIKTT